MDLAWEVNMVENVRYEKDIMKNIYIDHINYKKKHDYVKRYITKYINMLTNLISRFSSFETHLSIKYNLIRYKCLIA